MTNELPGERLRAVAERLNEMTGAAVGIMRLASHVLDAAEAEIAEMRAALEKAERVLCGWDGAEDSPEEKEALRAVRDALGVEVDEWPKEIAS